MKLVTAFAFLLIFSFQSFSQVNQDKLFFAGKAEKYRKMKNTGVTLTVTGGVLFVIGVVTLLNYSDASSYNSNTGTYQNTTTGNLAGGLAAYFIGAAGVGAGVPLWIIGAHSERKYNRKLEDVSFKLNINPRSTGLTLTYRF